MELGRDLGKVGVRQALPASSRGMAGGPRSEGGLSCFGGHGSQGHAVLWCVRARSAAGSPLLWFSVFYLSA